MKDKEESYPKNVLATEYKAEVSLQDLFNHTAGRLLKSLDIRLSDIDNFDVRNNEILDLSIKLGYDGTAVNAYRQMRMDPTESHSDDHILFTSSAPLLLVRKSDSKELWKNPNPSSSNYVRPVKLEYIRETKDNIKKEKLNLEEQMKNLKDLVLPGYTIKFNTSLTMIDGKVSRNLIFIDFFFCS